MSNWHDPNNALPETGERVRVIIDYHHKDVSCSTLEAVRREGSFAVGPNSIEDRAGGPSVILWSHT